MVICWSTGNTTNDVQLSNNLKTYVCKHALGISIHFDLYVIPDLGKLEDLGKRRGRPKKAKL
jgi:hypothetical protein